MGVFLESVYFYLIKDREKKSNYGFRGFSNFL